MSHPLLRRILHRRLFDRISPGIGVLESSLHSAIDTALDDAGSSGRPWLDWLTDPAKFLALVKVIMELLSLFGSEPSENPALEKTVT